MTKSSLSTLCDVAWRRVHSDGIPVGASAPAYNAHLLEKTLPAYLKAAASAGEAIPFEDRLQALRDNAACGDPAGVDILTGLVGLAREVAAKGPAGLGIRPRTKRTLGALLTAYASTVDDLSRAPFRPAAVGPLPDTHDGHRVPSF